MRFPLRSISTPPALPTVRVKRRVAVHSRTAPACKSSSATWPSSTCTRSHVGSTARTIKWWLPGLASPVVEDAGGGGAGAEAALARAAELGAGASTAGGAGAGGGAGVWAVDGEMDASVAFVAGLEAGSGVVGF